MKLTREDCDALLNIAQLMGHEVKEKKISLKEGYDLIRGAIIMFMMAFNVPRNAIDDVATFVYGEFSDAVRGEDNE